ncbi:hypothetical protein BDQ17DRAFT_1183159, partial [Cyathus striatus]
ERMTHTCLMLILFLSWRNVHDLRKNFSSWFHAFSYFYDNCLQNIREKIDNMQVLHKCKDSRDDHFA